ncbi:MAG: hypothetical protein C7B46_14730 [Sulfobacillus benefaciens]|uniref:PD-(D/E)XK endonuclease-like domain-containing protein n=1 Tax=Sulfobacillus benefaciens TaxID=453960 RepID=A0A2T2XD18_9FIRM|nr:MAG: hypothetical protein C7B46_14730 [Sulfobacillus benefaciens]
MRSEKSKRAPKLFPPSMAGHCLRYAVMELLGFGRLITPESQAAMRAGSKLHKTFQQELLQKESVRAIEAPIRDVDRGISGRIDAVLDDAQGPLVVEYKTVNHEKFIRIANQGPLIEHWAQLQLYLAVGEFSGGRLVVESRETHGRLTYHSDGDQAWETWVLTRVQLARKYQESRKLPVREISAACGHCDRWQRCFSSEIERDQAVQQHPEWDTDPVLPDALRIVAIS